MVGNYSIKIYGSNTDISSDNQSEVSAAYMNSLTNITLNVLTVKMRPVNEAEEREHQSGYLINRPLVRLYYDFEGVFVLPSDNTVYTNFINILKYRYLFIQAINLPYSIHSTNYVLKVKLDHEVNPELNKYFFVLKVRKEKRET